MAATMGISTELRVALDDKDFVPAAVCGHKAYDAKVRSGTPTRWASRRPRSRRRPIATLDARSPSALMIATSQTRVWGAPMTSDDSQCCCCWIAVPTRACGFWL